MKVKVIIKLIADASLVADVIKKNDDAISDESHINVNQTDDGYLIIYTNDLFGTMDPKHLMYSIVKMFKSRFPKLTVLDVEFTSAHHPDSDIKPFVRNTLKVVRTTSHMTFDGVEVCFPGIPDEKPKKNIPLTLDVYEHYSDPEDYEDDEEEPDEDDEDDYDLVRDLMKDSRKKRSKYMHSCSWHNSKDAKKMVRRHGVLVASTKDIKRDRKAIREFLDDFLPGSAGWKKEFKDDVCKRWLQMYVISKGRLHDLEKDKRRKRQKKNAKHSADIARSVTRQMFQTDRWTDPRK